MHFKCSHLETFQIESLSNDNDNLYAAGHKIFCHKGEGISLL